MRPSGGAVLCAVRAVLVTLAVTCSLQAQNRNVISGVVKRRRFGPRSQRGSGPMTFFVTQGQGRYSTPGLPRWATTLR